MRRTADPRTHITPESFAIAPDLIGLPLARPSRRLVAMLLDLVPVAVVASAGLFVFLAAAAAVAAWRATSAWSRRRRAGRLGRALAAFVAFVWVVQLEPDRWFGGGSDDGQDPPAETGDRVAMAVGQALQFVPEDQRTPELDSLISALTDTAEDTVTLDAAAADSAVIAYAAAIERGDSAAAAALRPDAERAIAGPRISVLRAERAAQQERLRELERDRDRLEKALEDRSGGIRGLLSGLADDLGIGFGWGALYFTAFLVLGRGQTPGKRAMGIRVIRLDGRPIGWWHSFERFGSYFASLTTGLLGFAQILWDRNRQGLHDKVVETVVIRVRRAPPLHVR